MRPFAEIVARHAEGCKTTLIELRLRNQRSIRLGELRLKTHETVSINSAASVNSEGRRDKINRTILMIPRGDERPTCPRCDRSARTKPANQCLREDDGIPYHHVMRSRHALISLQNDVLIEGP